MKISYLYSKFFKKFLRGKCVLNSTIDKTSPISSGTDFYNSSIGRYSYISYDCLINCTDIGSFCSIGNDLIVGMPEHPLNWVSMSPVFENTKHSGPAKRFSRLPVTPDRRTTIGNDVWIGSRVIIKQGITVSDGAVIGAGSVVTKDVPPYAVVAGVPARVIKYRFDKPTIERLINTKWWTFDNKEMALFADCINDTSVFLERVENYLHSK